MKKKSRWIVAIGMVLALMLALFPTQVMADPGTSVDPNGPYYPAAGAAMITVDINVTDVTDLSSGQFKLLYDKTVISYLGAQCPVGPPMGTGFWPAFVSNPAVAADDSNPWGTQFVFYDQNAGGYDGSGTIVNIWFAVPGESCDSTDLDLSTESAWNDLADSSGVSMSCTWSDGFLEVDGPCAVPPCAPPPTVVSGIEVPGAPGSEEPGAWVPAGFEPCDEFMPCEMLWVWGEGDPCHFCQWYTIWIQPYEEGVHVFNGDVIDPLAVPPGFVPVDVHIDELGRWGPIELWHVDGEYCELWEIVADKWDEGTVGVYDCDWDMLDAVCCAEWGFHIYPEGLTIILVSLGLLAVGGYILVVRRRRGAETDLDL